MLGLTQQQAAQRAGVSLATWRRFESDGAHVLAEENRRGVAKALQMPADELYGLHGVPPQVAHDYPLVRHIETTSERARLFNHSFGGQLTPRQALALAVAASEAGDEGEVTWEDVRKGDTDVDEVSPFIDLPDWVLFTANLAWLNRFRKTFLTITNRINKGHVPYPRCVAEEVALYLTISYAKDTTIEELFDVEFLAELDDHGDDDRDFDRLLDTLFQDNDFKALWGSNNSLAEPTAATQMGTTPDTYHPHNWWRPFDNADAFDDQD